MLLRYDGRTLVLFNRSSARIFPQDLNFVLFEPASNNPDNFRRSEVFEARDWGNLSRGIRSERCLQVWALRYAFLPLNEPPADICVSRAFYLQSANSFWFSDAYDEGAYFEVRLGPDVITSCPTARTNSLRELRCVFDIDR